MYDILAYGRMIKDPVRFHAYMEALRRTVKPGSVVLDMGTGPGIMALLACRFGARKVYAVEPEPIIQVAREIAISNGFADRLSSSRDCPPRSVCRNAWMSLCPT